MNTIVKVRNTEANRSHLTSIGIFFQTIGNLLHIEVSDYHEMWIANGKMSVAAYKKNILCL